jgi:hypothetical protein
MVNKEEREKISRSAGRNLKPETFLMWSSSTVSLRHDFQHFVLGTSSWMPGSKVSGAISCFRTGRSAVFLQLQNVPVCEWTVNFSTKMKVRLSIRPYSLVESKTRLPQFQAFGVWDLNA